MSNANGLSTIYHISTLRFNLVFQLLWDNILQLAILWKIVSFTGKAKGILFEDDGDGYGFTEGEFLLTHYVAELRASIVTIRVSKTEGYRKRPNRHFHVHLLLGGGAKVRLLEASLSIC